MSKKNYNQCEGCGLQFHNDNLVLNNDLELTCPECVEEAKRDKRVSNLLLTSCVAIAVGIVFLIFNHCSKSPRYFVPASRLARSKLKTMAFFNKSGTSP